MEVWMAVYLKNGRAWIDGEFIDADLLMDGDDLTVCRRDEAPASSISADAIDCSGKFILPGFADVHVHFREPGFSFKETIRTGSESAARGGYSCVCTMPNLKPVPSDLDGLKAQLDIIDRDARVRIKPYGAITKNQDGRSELSYMEALAPYVCAFTDDGKGVQDRGRMRAAMETAKGLGKLIVAHCEDEALLGGTAIHDGAYARSIHHTGISSASEWKQVERDVKLADETGCGYHVCHVSTKESVEIIRDAKKSGVDVTCETGPHYLTLTEDDLYDIDPNAPESGRFKMNPPLRAKSDRDALIAGILDGTVDMIATDHAPHTWEEKHRGLLESASGVLGLETALPVVYTKLVREGIMTPEILIDRMSTAPIRRFGLPSAETDRIVVDFGQDYRIDPGEFKSMGRSTPFEGWKVRGQVLMNFVGGECVYKKPGFHE